MKEIENNKYLQISKHLSFESRIIKNSENINDYLENQDEDNNLLPKDRFWFDIVKSNVAEDFICIHDKDYDLVGVKYLDNWFSMPVEVLSQVLNITNEEIKNLISNQCNDEDIEYI